MIDETLTKDLLRVLRAIDAERDSAKEDAKEHKEWIDELLTEALDIRKKLEGTGPTLFDDPGDENEPTRGTALAEKPSPGIDAYEQGAQARRDGRPESDCPFERGSYHGNSWVNGWRELEELPEETEGEDEAAEP